MTTRKLRVIAVRRRNKRARWIGALTLAAGSLSSVVAMAGDVQEVWNGVYGPQGYHAELIGLAVANDGSREFLAIRTTQSFESPETTEQLVVLGSHGEVIQEREAKGLIALTSRANEPVLLVATKRGFQIEENGKTLSIGAAEGTRVLSFEATPGGYLLTEWRDGKTSVDFSGGEVEHLIHAEIQRKLSSMAWRAMPGPAGGLVVIGSDSPETDFAMGGQRVWLARVDAAGKTLKTIELSGRYGDVCRLTSGAYVVAYDRSFDRGSQEIVLVAFDDSLHKLWERNLGRFDAGLGGGRFVLVALRNGFVVAGPVSNRPWLSFRGIQGDERTSLTAEGFALVREISLATDGSTVVLAGRTLERDQTAGGKWRNLMKVRVLAVRDVGSHGEAGP